MRKPKLSRKTTTGLDGYASSTVGFNTQGDLHIGGNSTFDGTGHDSFSDFVANEHLDWEANVGTIDVGNYIEYTDAQVADYIVGSSTVPNLICPNNEIAKSDGSGWDCAADDDSGGTFTSNWSVGTDESWMRPSTTVGIVVAASSTVQRLTIETDLRVSFLNATNTNTDFLLATNASSTNLDIA